jgi:trans-2,3-dihydro-3-hydroxyanthranilate isomerase
MKGTRRRFLKTLAVSSMVPPLFDGAKASTISSSKVNSRRFRFVQIDVFTFQRLEGNPLSVFTDARGLSDSEMQSLARETNLQETTFVLPRDSAVEEREGVQVRMFTPDEEIPFGGHPTLGTATVLRTMRLSGMRAPHASTSSVVLDLKVGKVPVSFREEAAGLFGEMQQVLPVFGRVHDRSTVAAVLGLNADEIEPDLPIQTISTGLPFVIVPIKRLNVLQRLHLAPPKAYEYLNREEGLKLEDFYYVTRDTGDPKIGLRARAIYDVGEDPATGSAAGCSSAWMVKYGVAEPDETVLILQGVEAKRPSKLFVRSSKTGSSVSNVRVGGHAVQIMNGEASL